MLRTVTTRPFRGVACTYTGVVVRRLTTTTSTSASTSAIAGQDRTPRLFRRPKEMLAYFFQKPNEYARSKVPLSEEDLDRLGKREVLHTAGYYRALSAAFDTNAWADVRPDMLRAACEIADYEAAAAGAPAPGSVVEAYTAAGDVMFGVVVPAPAKAAKRHDVVHVYTVEGHFKRVQSCSVTFCAPKFFRRDAVADVQDAADSGPMLAQLRCTMGAFVQYCVELDSRLVREDVYTGLYLHVSSNSSMRSVDMGKAHRWMLGNTDTVPTRIFTNVALAFLVHFHCVNSPDQFVAYAPPPRPLQRTNFQVFAVPRFTSAVVQKISRATMRKINEFRDFVAYMQKDAAGSEPLGPNVRSLLFHSSNMYHDAFSFLKFYMKYPHPQLRAAVWNLLGEKNVSPGMINAYLQKLRLFEGGRNDALLSSELFGRLSASIGVTDPRQILPKDDYDDLQLDLQRDHFAHLRTDTTAGRPDIDVFGIPTVEDSSVSELAFSIVKKNSRDWTVNLHVPDVGSFVSPRSDELFAKILKRPFARDVKLPSGTLRLLPRAVRDSFVFKDESAGNSCITISFHYNRSDPSGTWANPRPEIRLDAIANVTVLTPDELDVISGEAGLLSFQPKYRDIRHLDFEIPNDFAAILKSSVASGEVFRDVMASQANADVTTDRRGKIDIVSSSHNMTTLIVGEARRLVDSLAATYCSQRSVPMYYHARDNSPLDTAEAEAPGDESWGNVFRHWNPYKRLVLSVIQQRWPAVTDTSVTLLPSVGAFWVNFSSPTRSLEQIVNQWQVLKSLQAESAQNSQYASTLAIDGYADDFETIIPTKHGRDPIALDSFYDNVIREKSRTVDHIVERSRREWAIKWVKQNFVLKQRQYAVSVGHLSTTFTSQYFPELRDDSMFWMKCIVMGTPAASGLVPAYCMSLGIDVEIWIAPEDKASIGDRLICSTLVYLDELEEKIILME